MTTRSAAPTANKQKADATVDALAKKNKKNRICREYVQGICRRKFCKYPHVASSEAVVFCHDYQNSECPRIKCKFLHYSVDDEEYYRRFGKFPANAEFELESLQPPSARLTGPAHVANVIDPYAYGGQYNCSTTPPEKRWQPSLPPPPPPPMAPPQHQNHMYRSSYSTQFDQPQQQTMRHSVDYGASVVHRRPPQDYQMRQTVAVEQYGANETNGIEQQAVANYRQPTIQHQQQQQHTDKNISATVQQHQNHQQEQQHQQHHHQHQQHQLQYQQQHQPQQQQQQQHNQQQQHHQHNQQHDDDFAAAKRPAPARYEAAAPPAKRFRDENVDAAVTSNTDIMAILRRFEEEHNNLRRRVESIEMKISELHSTNDYLLSQHHAPYRLNGATTQQCTRGINPVTVTTSQPQTTQVINAVSIAPVQLQTTPIVSMAGPQIIASTSCGTPLALSANTSQGQQIALAQQGMSTLSNTSQPMSASQILGTSQITLTPTLAPAPSLGLTINTSQALAISNATQPIISYPVMTHSILPH